LKAASQRRCGKQASVEFIRRLLKMGSKPKQQEVMRGSAPIQSTEEQDASRKRMEDEMVSQRERREGKEPQA
jgi:hypothetical protein